MGNWYIDMIAASQRCNGYDRGNSEGEMWNQGITAQPVQEIQRGPDSRWSVLLIIFTCPQRWG